MTAPVSEQMLLDVVEGLVQQIEDLRRLIPPAGPAGAAAPAGPPPVATWWRDRATAGDWTDLDTWIRSINDSGSLDEQWLIPSCWRDHPGLVEDLAAVHEAWRNAMIAQAAGIRTSTGDPVGGSVESSMWFTQALWPMLDRFRDGRYVSSQCTQQHVSED